MTLFLLIGFCYAEARMEGHLKATKYLNINETNIHETSHSVTLGLLDDRAKAVAIHDFVRDRIFFGFSTFFWKQSASQVLAEKKGFCNTKSTLFVALLRSTGIPARQIFVNINSKILDGFLKAGSEFVDHSYVEVLIEGVWIKTDSFILDPNLFNSAQKRLKAENKKIGYGTIAGASNSWDGKSNSFSQFLPDLYEGLSTINHGEFDDIGDFYSRSNSAINGSWFNRFVFNFLATGANTKIQKIRDEN